VNPNDNIQIKEQVFWRGLLSSISQIGYNHLMVFLSVLKDLIPKRVVLRINTRLVGLDIVLGLCGGLLLALGALSRLRRNGYLSTLWLSAPHKALFR
jgi:hypothetical protein